ncbi:hypothetical protein A4A49_65155, partial [Nicotiana attenuata]
GRPLHVDLATQNGTRPSCAKVKVEVNLLATLPQRIKIIEEADETGPEESKWIKIRYDYMPKYCKTCKKQGHNEEECWIIHPELHNNFGGEGNDQGKERAVVVSSDAIRTTANSTKMLSSGKVVGKPSTNHAKQEWMQERKNKYQRDKRGHIIEDKQGKEIPSQTHEDSGKIDELNEVNSKNLWSDEVEVLESQQVEEQVIGSNANKSTNQVQKTRNPGDATVNPSSCQIRVEDNSSSMMKQAEISIVRGQGTSKETGNQDGSAQASLSKRKGNGTVNPSKTGEILAFVDGVPV